MMRDGMPELSVTGRRVRSVGRCGACEEEKQDLRWEERELGPICRSCANLMIELELEQLIPALRLDGGKGKK